MIDIDKARQWLKAKGIEEGCKLCGSPDLRISRHFYALPVRDDRLGTADAAAGSKLVRLRCGRCGHVLLFHARQMGLDPDAQRRRPASGRAR